MKSFLPRVSTACLLAGLTTVAPAGLLKHLNHKSKTNASQDTASKQPDKELYDKAMQAMKEGKYDVARLDLQTMLNTYPESEYQMRAKLAVGDSWFKEGGSASLIQAEAEYKDFITFFPNQPEAAEAQMRVADIYYMQMEKPDRDPTNANRAEEEYRTMIQQYPDSPLVPRAKQKLREVQEVLAERQYRIGSYYASRENWQASIARLQTLTDRYPLYSHSDLALIALGDSYAGEARRVQLFRMDNKVKQELMKAYDDRAAEMYARVVTHYSMAPHVEDARERLIALNRPVPEPTQQELADSEAEEQSRVGVTLKDRALFLVKHGPSTVDAARIGEPTLTDPPQVTAPDVIQENKALFAAALSGKPLPSSPQTGPAATEAAANSSAPGQTPESGGDEPLQLENVPSAESGASGSPEIGASIVSPGTNSGGTAATQGAAGSPAPAASAANPGAGVAATAAGVPGAQNPGGLAPVGPTNNTPLPPVEKPAMANAQINDVHGANTAQVKTGTSTGAGATKKAPPKYNSSEESSSKHKKKKGLEKLNPF